jgi:hypothetical protein
MKLYIILKLYLNLIAHFVIKFSYLNLIYYAKIGLTSFLLNSILIGINFYTTFDV